MWPRVSRISEDSRTASAKSPVMDVRAAEKKIAEAVAFQARAFLKAVLEQSREQGFVFGERNDAIAHVARRKHVEFFAQTAAGSAIVAHRDHAAQFANGRLTGGASAGVMT